MAADPNDVATLARKLRGKGLSDDQVRSSLREMGFRLAHAVAAGPAPPAPGPTPPTPARPPNPAAGGTPPAAPAAPTAPKLDLPTPDLSNLTLTPPKNLNGGDVAGFLFGLGLYALALNFLRYGPAGVTGWLGAKFLNRPADLGAGKGVGNLGPALPQAQLPSTTGTGLISTRPTAT